MIIDAEWLAAATALVAVILGPIISIAVARWQNNTNLIVAQRQIDASTVSASRPRWIDALREDIAGFQAVVTELTYRATLGPEGKWHDDPRMEKAILLHHRIALRTNPNEDDHRELVRLIGSRLNIVSVQQDRDALLMGQDLNRQITALSQSILKREWERVKNGEPLRLRGPSSTPAPPA